ncbi:MAG TPA: response regulator [Pyrinomonadaceae bacterium]|nr:response regulator [Pyrinomonadaceae bacterium]
MSYGIPSFPKGRILCTEDDPDSRELMIYLLSDAGYDVDCTDNPFEAIERARNECFDLFLVDNWMPGITGEDLTLEIRKFNRSTPILFYSAAAYDADRQRAFNAGAQGYLVKPEGITAVLSEVARLIAEAKIAFPVAIDAP